MHGSHEGFNWIHHIPGLNHYPTHVVMATLIVLALTISSSIATLIIKRTKDITVPDGTLTYRNFFFFFSEKLYSFCESILGEHDAEKYFPVIGTLFILIFTSNIMGLIPGLTPPTDNINMTLALGLFVFIYYNYLGFKENGFGYLKHFMGPVIFLAPMMFVIELISHLARPLSLALRLRGNMMGDHIVIGVFLNMAPYVVPTIFYFIGLFVSFVQAYVFCLLSMIYISLSTAHDH